MSTYVIAAIVEIVAGILILAVPQHFRWFVAGCLIIVGALQLLR